MDIETHPNYAINGKIMLVSSILVFAVVLFVLIFHRYIRRCFRRFHHNRLLSTTLNNTSSSTSGAIPSCKTEGLDASILKNLPIFTYHSLKGNFSFQPLQECVVCLSEFQDKDRARFLPCCNNTFHAYCIDTWFHSNSTCPLCRAPVHPLQGPLQPPKGFSAEPLCSDHEPGSSRSPLPQPIWCPRKQSERIDILVEVPAVAGDDVLREPECVGAGAPSENPFKLHSFSSLKKIWSK